MDFSNELLLLLQSGLRTSAPMLLACLAGLYSERAGVIDIGLEGKLTGAAFAAACGAWLTGSAWAGMAFGVAAGVAMALLHGYATITQRGNQVVSGVAINFLALGLTAQLAHSWFHQGGSTPPLEPGARFTAITLPGAKALADVPLLGTLYSHLLSGQTLYTYLAFAAVPLTWWLVYRTRFGLRLRAVGENPKAVDVAGISVTWLRYRAVLCCGVLCGLGGACLSTAMSASFVRNMAAGRGFLALAALVFVKWRPVPALIVCVGFGVLDALSTRLQGTELPLVGVLPVQFMQALPYVLTVVLLAGLIGQAHPPKAGGVPYQKELSR